MRKVLITAALMVTSFQAFSQSSRCEMRVEKLQEKVASLSRELAMCERNGGGSSAELNYLRSENLRLSETNRILQQRIDELQGNGYEQFFCSAGCTNVNGNLDTRYLATGTAYFQAEADMLAKQAVQKQYSCNFGVKIHKCESFVSDRPTSYCTAACVNVNGNPDQRYLEGSSGRNRAEAEALALKLAQSKHSCNFGVKVVTCN